MENNNLEHKRHTLAHLLAAAILKLYPDALNTIGPAIDNGFYYDFEFKTPLKEEDLKEIQKTMKKELNKWTEFSHQEVGVDEAKNHFKDNPYKLELIKEIAEKGEKITLYTSGGFTDLCRGGHLEHPNKEIDTDAFKLSRVAGAYWRGDEKNKMLTRIYGLAFDSREELDAYEKQIEEAEKRDHKKLGKELDLFTFSELIGSGLPLWTPKGTLLRNALDDFVWELRKAQGYMKVEIPHITKKDLYEKSGHWAKFSEELFRIKTREGHEFAMKPMNCPHHTQIYDRKQHSYRELPQRYANTTMCYRDEQSGELQGLSRVRSFTQDDAHVFCRWSDAKKEALKVWDIISTFYGAVGFELKIRLSLRDPKAPEKYLGTDESWKKTEDLLREIIQSKNTDFFEAEGEAAFYGPKIDFIGKDSLGREWQVATIQLDTNMPERFDLTCINEKSEKERVVMIHAAIMGSIERYLSIIIEHFAGAFPLWLSPVQVAVVPVRDTHNEIAKSAFEKLLNLNIRAELKDEDLNLGKKIREVKVEKIPYTIIIGDKDIEAGKVTLESRDNGNIGQLTIEEVLEKLNTEIKDKK